MKVDKTIKMYAVIAFTLLGVLFGMNLMTFIFGQTGSNAFPIDDLTATVTNETGAWLNATTYTVATSGTTGFSGLTILSAINTTDNSSIGTGNFTVSGSGFTNATATIWDSIWVTYSYNYYSDQRIAQDDVQNNSLQAIVTYSDGTSTQMSTLSIAIILVLLVSVFLIFWKIFVSQGKKGSQDGGNFA